MVTMEELPEEGEVTSSELVPAPVIVETVPLTFSKGREESTDPKDMRPSFPVEMMSSMGMLEQSLTTGLVAVKFSVAEVAYARASPSSSSEEVDYSGSDVDWDIMHPAPNGSKFSHLATKEIEVISVEGNL